MKRRRLAIWSLALLGLLLPTNALADDAQTVFRNGNAALYAGDYARAIRQYEQLLEAGVADANVLTNLGTAHARRGSYGRAIWAYERALVARPGDDDATRSRAAVYAALGRRRAEASGEAVVAARPSAAVAVVGSFRASTIAWVLLIATWLTFGALIGRMLASSDSVRVGLGTIAIFGALSLGASATGLAIHHESLSWGKRAVILADQIPLRDGPDERATTSLSLSEGDRVTPLRRDQGFVEVRTATGRVGWIDRRYAGTY